MAKASKKSEPPQDRSMIRQVVWVFLAGLAVMLIASLISFDPADMGHYEAPHHAQPANWCGAFGAVAAYHAYRLLGPGVWILIASIVAWLWASALGRTVTDFPLRAFGIMLVAIAASSFVAMSSATPEAGTISAPEGAGGLIAIAAVDELTARFNEFGTYCILLMVFGVGMLVAADQLVLALPKKILTWCGALRQVNWPKPVLVGWPWRQWSMPKWNFFGRAGGGTVVAEPLASRRKRSKRGETDDPIDEEAGGLGATDSFDPEQHRTRKQAAQEEDVDDGEEIEEELEIIEEEIDEPDQPQPAGKKKFDADALREKIKKLPITFASQKRPTTQAPPRAPDLSGYEFPSLSLLVEPEYNFSEEMDSIVREQAEALERALQLYRVEAEVVAIDSGPVITLYEVKLAPGTRVAAITAVSSDIARELKAQNIRIVPNTAGRSTVGIEVPNLKKEKVRLKELMQLSNEKVQAMALPMFLGKDASGNPLVADLGTMPHMLIAGTTGSGKSVCMNSVLMSFLYTKRPDELKLVLVDPKMVEMSQFKSIPHLMCPVVTDMPKAAAILEWAVTKMDERYTLLAEAGVRDIDSYNRLEPSDLFERMGAATEDEQAMVPKKLPRLVFVIDELADLMITNKEVETHIVRIAQKARAVGMHLILATQRPSANVVTGLIKSNMPCRISFKVNSGMDSRIVLDAKGAELLLGQGDMLFLSPRSSKLTRAQGTLVDDMEIRNVVRFVKEVAGQNFERQIMQLRTDGEDPYATNDVVGRDGLSAALKDPLFEESVRIVVESQRGSVSLLQRRLSIGYGRAARLIDQMAELGILGEYKGAQAREVTLTLDDWESMKAQAEAELAAEAEEAAEAEASAGDGGSATSSQADTQIEEDEDTADEDIEEEDEDAADEDNDEEVMEYEYVEEDDEYADEEDDDDSGSSRR